MRVKLSIQQKGETRLVIHHMPDFSTTKGVAMIFALSGFLFLVGQIVSPESNWATFAFMVAFVFFFIMAFCAFDAIELESIFDRATGKILHKRGGVLRSQVGAKEIAIQLSEVAFIEIKRNANRGIDLFQINVGLKNKEKLYITAKNLSFSEVHQYAEQIHQFLGKEIPLKAVD